MRYSEGTAGLDAAKLAGFFVGWPNPPSAASLCRVLEAAPYTLLAWEGEDIVGFVYAVSDGLIAAYIPLLEVRPERQHEGIGTELVSRLLAMLQDVYMIDVVCDGNVAPFYRKLGLQPAVGLVRRNYDAPVVGENR